MSPYFSAVLTPTVFRQYACREGAASYQNGMFFAGLLENRHAASTRTQ